MCKELVGRSFKLWNEQVTIPGYEPPTESEIHQARSSLMLVQLGPKDYTAAFILPNGQPQVPPNLASTHHALQRDDGHWCLVPKTDSRIPGSWESRPDLFQKTQTHTNQAQITTAQSDGAQKAEMAVNTGEQTTAPNHCASNKSPNDQVTPLPDHLGLSDHAITRSQACTEAGRSASPQLPNYQLTQLPNPAGMMDNLEALIRQHLVCTEAQRTVLALWILHTYTYRAAPLTPYLRISSRVEESGKSTCMTILRSLCARPWWGAGVSRSVFTRKILADQPTVLLDNWQTVFSSSDKTQTTGFLLTGCDQAPNLDHDNCTEVNRSNDLNYPITKSPNYQILDSSQSSPFCPKAFAGPDPLPPSLSRRSIPIVLQRPKPGEIVKRATNLLAPEATEKLTSRTQEWARAHEQQIETTFENCGQFLPGLTPHQQESAKVLIALAETIGGEWPQKARTALVEVFQDAQQSEVAPLQLLSDIRDAFAHHGNPERIFTAELLDYLHGLDHRTWYEWSKKGDPMTPHALSVILRKSFNIYSRSQRRGEDKRRGYLQSDFVEAWERYLIVLTPQNTANSNATEAEQETSVAATTEPLSVNKHTRRQAEKLALKRGELCRTEVRQRNKTVAQPRKSYFVSQLKAGCRRLVNKFTASALGLLMIMHQ
jgi:hypothetical protein